MNINRNIGISAIAVTIVMLSVGSLPQSFAGSDTVSLGMQLQTTCGIAVTGGGTVDFGAVNISGPNESTIVTVDNTGTADAQIDANAGNTATGGFHDAVPVTHIAPSSITLDLDIQGVTPMLNTGLDQDIGQLFGAGSLDVVVSINVINLPVPDNTQLDATITLTANC